LLIAFFFVVGAGKLIRVYVLYGVYTRPFTNSYSLLTKFGIIWGLGDIVHDSVTLNYCLFLVTIIDWYCR
jgi:hypothetical protein